MAHARRLVVGYDCRSIRREMRAVQNLQAWGTTVMAVQPKVKITLESVVKETPIGPMDNKVMCIEVDGRKYHQLEPRTSDFLDLRSGEIVQIKIVDWVPQIVGK